LTIPDLESIEDYRWFQMTLPAGVYNLDASTSSTETETLQFTFDLFERFGDVDNESRIGSDSESGTSLSGTFQFEVLDNNDIWIRAHTTTGPRAVEFTVSQ